MLKNAQKDFIQRHIGPSEKEQEIMLHELGYKSLDELIKKNFIAKRLSFTTDIDKAISISDTVFICVGTPTKKGSIKVDLSFVYKCAKEISHRGLGPEPSYGHRPTPKNNSVQPQKK